MVVKNPRSARQVRSQRRGVVVGLSVALVSSVLSIGVAFGQSASQDARPKSLAKGDRLFKTGNYMKAADRYRRAGLNNLKCIPCRLAFAEALFSLGNYHYASHALRQAARLVAAKEPFGLSGTAARFPSRSSYLRARENLRRYLLFNPKNVSALTVLAAVYFSAGQDSKAKALCQTLKTLDPSDKFATFLEAQILRRRSPEKKWF